jgi:hypothetical protein
VVPTDSVRRTEAAAHKIRDGLVQARATVEGRETPVRSAGLQAQVRAREGDPVHVTAAGPAMPDPIALDRTAMYDAGHPPAINHEAVGPSGAAVTPVLEQGRAMKGAGSAEDQSAAGLAPVGRDAVDLLPFFPPLPGTACS